MSFEAGLTTYLKAHVGLKALISERVYPLRFPPGATMPCVVYQVMTGTEYHVGNYVEPALQLTIWSDDFDELLTVDAQLRAALEMYHGLMGTLHVRVLLGAPSDGDSPETGLCYRRRVARPIYKHPGS